MLMAPEREVAAVTPQGRTGTAGQRLLSGRMVSQALRFPLPLLLKIPGLAWL